MRPGVPRLTVYTRVGCTLCEQAERLVAELATQVDVDVDVVDIDAASALTDRYTVRVPVVAIDGDELFELQVDAEQLRAAVLRAAGR